MRMAEGGMSIQKYAMRMGTYMGVYWIAKFALFPLGLANPFVLLLFFAATIAVPFIGYFFAKSYRDKVCGGETTVLKSWMFLILMYMFSALLTAVAHYTYFRFIDNGYITETYSAFLDTAPKVLEGGLSTYIEQAKASMDIFRSMSAIEITMQLFASNILNCCIISLIIALFVRKKNPVM